MRPLLKTAVGVTFLVLGSSGLGAATARFWQVATQAELLKGEVENLSIDSHGRLVLGPASDLLYETTAPFLWSMIKGADKALYVGSGNEGKVFRVDQDGKGSVFFDANELEVHALAPAPKGGFYVGTSPEGRIYQVDRAGKATPFFDPDEKYIWALATDPGGNVYAATGEKGVVYKITPEGAGAPFYKTTATHVLSLAFDRAGNLLAGTGMPGKVFRFDRDGKPFVLVDTAFQEIRALRIGRNGVIYAAAVSGVSGRSGLDERPIDRPPVEPPGTPVPSVSTEITSISIVDVAATGPPPVGASARDDRRGRRGAVYRISSDGVSDIVWESREDVPYDLTFEAGGELLIATGSKGKIYRLGGEPTHSWLLTRAVAQQVTVFLHDDEGQNYYATANPGKIFRLSSQRAERGTYESEVRDARTVATWGAISWRGTVNAGSRIELSTRSGNSDTPDDTWSPWSAVYQKPGGEPITSPRARYLQWRATLTGKGGGPVLTSVTAAYMPRNVRPLVRSITVHQPGVIFQKPFSTGELEIVGFDDQEDRKVASTAATGNSPQAPRSGNPSLGKRIYQKGLQTFLWRADDENEDELEYDVSYRREGETSWTLLKRGLVDPIVVWDTSSVPNGTYLIKVLASDAPANPPGTALAGELESTTFDIDNTPPAITVSSVRRDGSRTVLSFEVIDDHSPIQRVEYSLGADRWRAIYPKDGIADSRAEQFELVLEAAVAARGVILRAADVMNNVATQQADVARR